MLRKISLFLALSIASVEGNRKTTHAENSRSMNLVGNRFEEVIETVDYSEKVLFYFYSKKNIDAPQQVFLNNITSIEYSDFNNSKPTKVLIHGWLDSLDAEMIQLNKNALLDNLDVNVIAVDWSVIACDILYFPIIGKVPKVGDYVGQFIKFLLSQASVNVSDVHVIGHSLGAQVSGFAGKALQEDGYTVPRISGLDPAWPGYYFANSDSRLASTDAEYVDVIHSCAYLAGFPTNIGHADFFPNGGIHPQPDCSIFDLVCSHRSSFRYFAQSVNETALFSSQPCKLVIFGIPIWCSQGSGGARMGYPASKQKDNGVFYLKT